MMRIPGMLLIGAFHRNAGKTTVTSDIIRQWSRQLPIVAVKSTIIRDNGTALGDTGFSITEESGQVSGKDTARMKAAGAERVFWLKSREDGTLAGIREILKTLSPGQALICEGNTIRRFVRPDVFLMVRNRSICTDKSSARGVCAFADLILESADGRPELPDDLLRFRSGMWRLARNLYPGPGIIVPAMENLPCRSI